MDNRDQIKLPEQTAVNGVKTPRLLVIRGGAIGDFICTLPAIAALRERWPEAHLEILGYPHISELANGRRYADALRPITARAMTGFFVPKGELDPELMEYFGSFNVIVSYLFDPDEVFSDNVRRCGVKQFIPASPKPRDLPAAAHYCQPLKTLAIYVERPVPRVYPSETDRLVAGKFLVPLGRERIAAIHPGSGSEKKNWPVEKFAALARWLVDELEMQLVVVQGEADERVVEKLVAAVAPRPVKLATGLKLVELAGVVERCAVFVGNDSGITHLAAAVRTPTVALFGPASVPIWEPRGDRVRVVQFGGDDVACARQVVGEVLSAS
ncbi:MAG: glycosyltransferase family 9 protein [Verrucomicrobiota bacterium]|jgi:heptosyltransferase III